MLLNKSRECYAKILLKPCEFSFLCKIEGINPQQPFLSLKRGISPFRLLLKEKFSSIDEMKGEKVTLKGYTKLLHVELSDHMIKHNNRFIMPSEMRRFNNELRQFRNFMINYDSKLVMNYEKNLTRKDAIINSAQKLMIDHDDIDIDSLIRVNTRIRSYSNILS